MRFATVLTCRPCLAEDLVSDVLCRAYERWDRISQVAEPHAYIRRMVLNEYLSWRRAGWSARRRGPTSSRSTLDWTTAPTSAPNATP